MKILAVNNYNNQTQQNNNKQNVNFASKLIGNPRNLSEHVFNAMVLSAEHHGKDVFEQGASTTLLARLQSELAEASSNIADITAALERNAIKDPEAAKARLANHMQIAANAKAEIDKLKSS